MKISTKSRYALEALLYMAAYSPFEPLSISQISEKTGISENYLAQIFFRLRKSGLLKTVRGAKGGFLIARPMSELTVNSVISSMGESLIPVDCVKDPHLCKSRVRGRCSAQRLWTRISNEIENTVNALTLEDLRKEYLASGIKSQAFV